MLVSPAVGLLCPACQTPLPGLTAGAASLLCPGCQVEVDAARLETLVGKPRFVAERSWVGATINGMVVEEMIGAGGMGTVYRARPARQGDPLLAVKFLSPSLAAEPELVARFEREVALLEKLDHPGIVKVRSHGENQGVPWFAMDLVDGPTLAQRLGKGLLGLDEARGIFLRLLEALDHAHGRGVVHRDLKPANVLLAADGARLADFGVAHLDLETVSRKTQLTRTSAILGTFPYMSPEQRAGRAVDARSDLYSVGVMLYESLAGERPEGAFPLLHRRRKDLSAKVDEAILRLLQPDPAQRLTSASAARVALARAFRPRPTVRRQVAWAGAGLLTLMLALASGSWLWLNRSAVPPAALNANQSPKANAVAPSPLAQTQAQEAPLIPRPSLRDPANNVAPPAGKTAKLARAAGYWNSKASKSFGAKDFPDLDAQQEPPGQSSPPKQEQEGTIGKGSFGTSGKMGHKTKGGGKSGH